MTVINQFPHCDSRVLHAPGECVYCDEHPDWQELREVWGINFTGHQEVLKMQCPADRARGDNHKLWGGNVAVTKEDIEKDKEKWEKLTKEIDKLMQLMPIPTPITKIIEENSIKDISQTEDKLFLEAINEAAVVKMPKKKE
jgi:hypothetical protein